MDKDTQIQIKETSREHMLDLWNLAREKNIDHLEGEDRIIAELFQQHEEQFVEDFGDEMADAGADDDSETEYDPFMHITIHTIIENQLRERTPIQVYQFYNTMRKKKVSHHETVHLIGAFLTHIMYDVIVSEKEFDTEKYILLLSRYKGKRPEKIWADAEDSFGENGQ